jgi:hypothetical protein
MAAVWNDAKQQDTRSAKWKTELAYKLREDRHWVRLTYSDNLSAFTLLVSKLTSERRMILTSGERTENTVRSQFHI